MITGVVFARCLEQSADNPDLFILSTAEVYDYDDEYILMWRRNGWKGIPKARAFKLFAPEINMITEWTKYDKEA